MREVPTQTYLYWKHLQATDPTAYAIRMHLHDAPQSLREISSRKPIVILRSGIIIGSAPHWTARVNARLRNLFAKRWIGAR